MVAHPVPIHERKYVLGHDGIEGTTPSRREPTKPVGKLPYEDVLLTARVAAVTHSDALTSRLQPGKIFGSCRRGANRSKEVRRGGHDARRRRRTEPLRPRPVRSNSARPVLRRDDRVHKGSDTDVGDRRSDCANTCATRARQLQAMSMHLGKIAGRRRGGARDHTGTCPSLEAVTSINKLQARDTVRH